MKNIIHVIVILLGIHLSKAQTNVSTSMGIDYINKVYYKLDSEIETSFSANSWDIAFLRTGSYEISIRENTHSGIQVFEASDNSSNWNSINIADEATWIALQSDNTDWNGGAFQFGSATYGWGEYNPINHHVTGSIIFVLKYPNGSFIKFINEDFFGGYTFKYAIWDGSSWSADYEASVLNSTNPDNMFNYYSFINHEEVITEPAITDWDFVFTKYFVDYSGALYPVVGVLQNPSCSIAENEEEEPIEDLSGLVYSTEKNTIGHDWKTYTGSEYEINSSQIYYIKYEDGRIFRLFFNGYEGETTGNIDFQFTEISDVTQIEEQNGALFGVYPNPIVEDKTTIIYDSKSDNNEISIINTLGKKVYLKKWNSTPGFHQMDIDLSSLNRGVYTIIIKTGEVVLSQKIIKK